MMEEWGLNQLGRNKLNGGVKVNIPGGVVWMIENEQASLGKYRIKYVYPHVGKKGVEVIVWFIQAAEIHLIDEYMLYVYVVIEGANSLSDSKKETLQDKATALSGIGVEIKSTPDFYLNRFEYGADNVGEDSLLMRYIYKSPSEEVVCDLLPYEFYSNIVFIVRSISNEFHQFVGDNTLSFQ